jgi:hypothetical protein
MSDSPQSAERIVSALRDLLSREAVAARAGSGLRVRAIQARTKPLVEALNGMSALAVSSRLKQAVADLAETRRRNLFLMKEAVGRIRREMNSRSVALARIRRIGPVYRSRTAVASRLNACT